MKSTELILTLLSIRGIGRVRAQSVLDALGVDTAIDHASLSQRINSALGISTITQPIVYEATQRACAIRQDCKDQGIRIIHAFDESYPSMLHEIDDPPLILYVKGDVQRIESAPRKLAIVGTRNPDHKCLEAIKHFVPRLISSRCSVFSGLAKGCDTIAHQETLGAEGLTFAVMGHGHGHAHPKGSEALAERILESGGCLISEYPPDSRPMRHKFIERNRLISGFSEIVLIMQARCKSGSMRTADFAQSQGRVLIVWDPSNDGNSISSADYSGNTHLVENQQADPVSSPEEIVEIFQRLETSECSGRRATFEQQRLQVCQRDRCY